MAFGIGSFLKGVGDDLGDALIPKEIAPYLGTIGALIAPVAPIAGLTMGQLASMKMNEGKLDPMQALAVGLGYYGGGGPQNRAEGKLFGQRMREGFSTASGSGSSFGSGDYFSEFSRGYNTPNPLSDVSAATKPNIYDVSGSELPKDSSFDINKQMQKPISERGTFNTESLSTTAEGDVFIKPTGKVNIPTSPDSPSMIPQRRPLQPKPTFLEKTGNVLQAGAEAVMPGFKGADGKFSLTNALTTVGTATTLSTLTMAAEELKKQKELDKAEQGRIWKEWFDGYKRVTGKDYYNKETGQGNTEFADPVLIEKYKQFMATGGRVGYNMGGDTGIIAAAPGMPQGMQLDGREGIFVSQGIEEKADDVPAMLSKNEFVLTADAMKGFDKMSGGNGDPRAAAQKMYQFMDQMEAIA